MLQITLPDGSRREFEGPVTVAEVAASIGAGLAKAALAGKVDGQLVDTSHRIESDAHLAIVTDKDAEALELIRHSTAHLLAYAVKELFPEAQVTIGPVIENGFYYDFAYKRPFTPEDLVAIEKRMGELAARNEPVVRRVLPRDEAVAHFKAMGEAYKAEIIGSIPEGQDVSLYREGNFEDLCRGPHVPSTGRLKHFKLMKVAGAYWRGDQANEQLQRIYGTAWASKEALAQYLLMLEEAEKRDHRRLGRELDLFHIDEHSPGMVFWHPKGWTVWQEVEQYMRHVYRDNGYQEVKGPQVLDKALWEKTGHWDKYRDAMFVTESEKRDYAIKPMNCPGHILIFKQGIKSYRDLPLRYGEFGNCHRNEPTGGLHGIMRRRPHLLHRRPHPAGMPGLHGAAAAGLQGLRLQRDHLQGGDAPGSPHRQRRDLGQGRKRADRKPEAERLRLRDRPRRRRLLRPEDRVHAEGCDRPAVAVRHDAGRLLHG